MFIQLALLVADQTQPDDVETSTLPLPPVEVTDELVGDTE
jgi:hypothetical protein